MIKENKFCLSNSIVKNTLYRTMLTLSLFSMSAYAQTSHSNDPLSLDEISKAALLTSNPQLSARGTASSEELESFTNNAQEILLIEKNEEKNAPNDQRRADVFIYDYSTNELVISLIDLNTSEVIQSERKQGVQLPLSNNELARAKQIIVDDEDELSFIEDEYKRITSRNLSDISELNIKAFTFRADSLPNRVNEASKQCGIHRCAQIMLYTQDNIVFEISPIVNLSEGLVTQRIGF